MDRIPHNGHITSVQIKYNVHLLPHLNGVSCSCSRGGARGGGMHHTILKVQK